MENTQNYKDLIFETVLNNFKRATFIFAAFVIVGMGTHVMINDLTPMETGFLIATLTLTFVQIIFLLMEKKIPIKTEGKVRVVSYIYGFSIGMAFLSIVNHDSAAYALLAIAAVPGILTLTKRNFLAYYITYSVFAILSIYFLSEELSNGVFRFGVMAMGIIITLGVRRTLIRIMAILEEKMGEAQNLFNRQKSLFDQLSDSTTYIDDRIQALSDNSSQLTRNSDDATSSVEGISNGATEQAEELNEGMNGLTDLSTMLEEVSSEISNLTNLSREREKKNAESLKYSEKMVDNAQSSKEMNTRIGGIINGLTTDFMKVVESINQINAIAGQTNLLALNASIESARAGEAGKGFAVVADEIRKLSEETSKSATEINAIIDVVNDQIKQSQEVMQELEKQSEESSVIVEQTTNDISETLDYLKTAGAYVDRISDKVNLIDEKRTLVLEKITNIASVSQEFTASSEEVTSTMMTVQSEIEGINGSILEISDQMNVLRDMMTQ